MVCTDFDWQSGYQPPYDGMTVQPTQQFILNNYSTMEGIQPQQYDTDLFCAEHTLGSIDEIDINEVDVMGSSFGPDYENDSY